MLFFSKMAKLIDQSLNIQTKIVLSFDKRQVILMTQDREIWDMRILVNHEARIFLIKV